MQRPYVLTIGLLSTAALCCALAVGAASAHGTTVASGSADAANGTWGGPAAVDGVGDTAGASFSVSCTAAGDCSAAGGYVGRTPVVISSVNGSWGSAADVPGLAALDQGAGGTVTSVSCTAPGDCAAGGDYLAGGEDQAFLVNQAAGTWGDAEAVPGLADLNLDDDAEVLAVSCSQAGDCAAGGYYNGGSNAEQPFVVDESAGTWGTAAPVPGLAAIGIDGKAEISSVSCTAPGDCTVGGGASVQTAGGGQAFVVSETNGVWGAAQLLPGLAALDVHQGASVTAVSCSSPGDCAVGGYYTTAQNYTEAFIASETDGTWGTATQVLGAASFPSATVTSVSCPAAGKCVAVGGYPQLDGGVGAQGFATGEAGGAWSAAIGLGPVNENVGGSGYLTSVSCPSAGYCAAVGFASTDASDADQMYAVDETGGTWGTAQVIPESAGGTGWGQVSSVSCGATGSCSAFGFFENKLAAYGSQAFVANEVPATRTVLSLAAPKVAFGNERADRFSVTVSAASGPPSGVVTVLAGAQIVCQVTLAAGQGSCLLAAPTQFAVGTLTLSARYPGDGTLLSASSSAGTPLQIQPEPTKTSLSLSTGKVTNGHEQAERLSITVAPGYSITPTGKITVKAGSAVLCTLTLAWGKGHCTLAKSRLRPGTYSLIASYAGGKEFAASASAKKTLTVAR